MGVFSWLFKCKHKTSQMVYSVEYTGDVQWVHKETLNAFLSHTETIKPKGPKFLIIERCGKCGGHIIGLHTSLGYAPYELNYVHSLFKQVTGKNVRDIIEGLKNDQVG